jgi:hypothetical protein
LSVSIAIRPKERSFSGAKLHSLSLVWPVDSKVTDALESLGNRLINAAKRCEQFHV